MTLEAEARAVQSPTASAVLVARVLLRLYQMLFALCLLHLSNTEAVLFAHLSSGWATTTGRKTAWPQDGSLSQEHSDALLHRESNRGLATSPVLYQLTHAAAS